MPITKALGLGILIIVLKFLLPEVLMEGVQTVQAFLHGATISAQVASSLAASAGSAIPQSHLPSALPDFPLPQAPHIR